MSHMPDSTGTLRAAIGQMKPTGERGGGCVAGVDERMCNTMVRWCRLVRRVHYEVEAERLEQATRAMADLATQWNRRLVTIKRLAEAAHAAAGGQKRKR
jgi:hypothetical protein